MDRLQEYLQDVMADMETTQPQYNALLRDKVKTYPIPFFGDIKRARVLTIGVNPSDKEFVKREWPDTMTSEALKDRLQHYYLSDLVSPHRWFKTWSIALALLGVSYQTGAAHLDLSPRATKPMSSVDPELFAWMVEKDIQWFFKLISECSEARLLIFAGCVTKWYINDFMKRMAPKHGFQFEGPTTPKSGIGKIGFYHLRGPQGELPAFFCSVSPSGRNRGVLIERVEEHKTRLLKLLDEQPSHSEM